MLDFGHQIFFYESRLDRVPGPLAVNRIHALAHANKEADVVVQFLVVEPFLQGLEDFLHYFPNGVGCL